ncbi:hypothetical protein M8C21_023528, partial [Ambrosia artemisiifolia]
PPHNTTQHNLFDSRPLSVQRVNPSTSVLFCWTVDQPATSRLEPLCPLLGSTLAGKMFFHIVLERNMQLHPRHFGRDLREKLVSKLMKDVEGTCSGRHGFVVAITGIENVGKGLIRDGTGFVTFPVKYQCVVFRPFKGEILEAVVSMVNKMGFFAEAGPVQIFVSNHLIPDDMEFQSGDMPNYTTSDGS